MLHPLPLSTPIEPGSPLLALRQVFLAGAGAATSGRPTQSKARQRGTTATGQAKAKVTGSKAATSAPPRRCRSPRATPAVTTDFEELLRVASTTARRAGAGSLADDIAQEMLIDVLEKPWLGEYQHRGAFITRVRWLVMNQRRNGQRRDARESDYARLTMDEAELQLKPEKGFNHPPCTDGDIDT